MWFTFPVARSRVFAGPRCHSAAPRCSSPGTAKGRAVSGINIPGICSGQARIKWRDVFIIAGGGADTAEQSHGLLVAVKQLVFEYGELESKQQIGCAQRFGRNY